MTASVLKQDPKHKKVHSFEPFMCLDLVYIYDYAYLIW